MHIPVTALDTILVKERRFIIVGQGPHLRLYDGGSHAVLSTHKLFHVQPIHHIAHRIGESGATIVAAGGLHIANVVLEVLDDGDVAIRTTSLQSIDAKEWILKVHSHRDDFVFLTTNNALFRQPDDDSSHISLSTDRLVQGPGASLYCGDFCTIDLKKLLVAAGSVFGEVLVWTCRSSENDRGFWVAETKHRFEGHTGSVFGVRISPEYSWGGRPARFVLSCSDDRTVQLWDVNDYEEPGTTSSGDEVVNTGFGQDSTDSRHRVAMGWGHQSRIWDVDFLELGGGGDSSAAEQLQIATRGEDGTCQYWSTRLPQRGAEIASPAKLLPVAIDRHHSGKNVWSWTKFGDKDQSVIVSGGADGRVVERSIPMLEARRPTLMEYNTPFKQLEVEPTIQSLKEYAIVDADAGHKVLAVTADGRVVRCRPQSNGEYQWSVVVNSSTFRVNKICSNTPPGLIVAATNEGVLAKSVCGVESVTMSEAFAGQVVASIQMASTENCAEGSRLCIIVTFMTGTAGAIWIDAEGDHLRGAEQALQLPEHFIVTSSCYDYCKDVLVLGSRAGAVAIFSAFRGSANAPLEPLCVRHVHGSDAVTSLQFLRASDANEGRYILSTGRDGRYAIHLVNKSMGNVIACFRTVHFASPPFGPHVEGATIVTSCEQKQRELILHGFRSKDFVVWNETKQVDVFSVDCGGAHRSWAYRHSASDLQHGGSFVWTKAGTFNLHSESRLGHQVIQTGGHGRETKALAVCPRKYSSTELSMADAPLFATGAEDTTIRIFAVRQAASDDILEPQLVQLCSMNDHTAGLQDLVFSPCGRFLFSSGGAEQLFAWSLSYDIPMVGIGSVLQDKMPQTDEDADVRIMSLSLREDGEPAKASEFRLAAAYSNGKVKMLRYRPDERPGKGLWELDREVLFGSFCLMQAFTFPAPVGMEARAPMLTAGTNGFVNLTTFEQEQNIGDKMELHSVHQSSILALDVVELSSGAYFIATGGDDNALGLTILTSSGHTTANESSQNFATIRIRDAHAAALTALKLLSADKESSSWQVRLATAGNDQRVNMWEVTIPMDGMSSPDSFRVVRVQQCWTAVADVSNIDVVETRLLVTGVGVEILRLDLGLGRSHTD